MGRYKNLGSDDIQLVLPRYKLPDDADILFQVDKVNFDLKEPIEEYKDGTGNVFIIDGERARNNLETLVKSFDKFRKNLSESEPGMVFNTVIDSEVYERIKGIDAIEKSEELEDCVVIRAPAATIFAMYAFNACYLGLLSAKKEEQEAE